MQKEMKMQVAASVEHYFALTEVKWSSYFVIFI
jgi:hypothetical protein